MKSLQTLMAGIDQRIKANAEKAQAEQGALQFEAEPEAPPRIEDTADQAQPPKARAKSSHRWRAEQQGDGRPDYGRRQVAAQESAWCTIQDGYVGR